MNSRFRIPSAHLFVLASFWLVVSAAQAHIGSPNVVFDGQAGPNPVRVIIRPPAAIPGLARVSVHSDGAKNVSVQITTGGGTAPPSVRANPVTEAPGLFQADMWLWYFGPCVVRVTVEGSRGSGIAAVPLNAAVTQNPSMPRELEAGLVILALILLVGAAAITGAAARESALAPDALTTANDCKRGRVAALLALFVLATGIAGGSLRWQTMDREFRHNALTRPQPVATGIVDAGTVNLLRLEPLADQTLPGWDTLMADHGKLMHLFLIREPGAAIFAHLHPVRRNARTFEAVLPALPAGNYSLYAEITHEDGRNDTLVARVDLPAPRDFVPQPSPPDDTWCKSPAGLETDAPQPEALDRDDSWSAAASAVDSRVSELPGGLRMAFQNAGGLIANRDTSLRFAVFSPEGEMAPLRPYMGMLGHCVVRRKDGTVFTHLHPAGTISMAMEEKLSAQESTSAAIAPTPAPVGREVIFPYAFPRPGEYRLWAQVCTGGRVLTGVFDVNVAPEP